MANISKIKLNNTIYTLKDDVSGYATEDYVDEAIEAIKQFDAIICTNNANTPKGVVWTKDGEKYTGTLEASDAEPRTFYMVYQEQGSGNDYYDEYMVINNAWEKIGNTHIDLSNYYTKSEVNTLGQGILTEAKNYTNQEVSGKQDQLTAGDNINITNNVISADGDPLYVSGDEGATGTVNADTLNGKADTWFQQKLVAGNNINIIGNTISSRSGTAVWGNIEGTLSDQADLQGVLTRLDDEITDLEENKQDVLSAGLGIDISNNTIKATGVEYKDNATVQSNPLKFVKLTQEEYDAITPDNDTLYMIV